MKTAFVITIIEQYKLNRHSVEKLNATLNSYTPTMTDKERYYLNKENIDNCHKLWIRKNNDELNARRRARYAEKRMNV